MAVAAEDDLYNRFYVLRQTCGLSTIHAFGSVWLFLLIETMSNFLGCLKRGSFRGFLPLLLGRLRGMARVIFTRQNKETTHLDAVL